MFGSQRRQNHFSWFNISNLAKPSAAPWGSRKSLHGNLCANEYFAKVPDIPWIWLSFKTELTSEETCASIYRLCASLNKLGSFGGQPALPLVHTFAGGIYSTRLCPAAPDEVWWSLQHRRPLQSSAAQSYLTELWLTQSQSINKRPVPFLELKTLFFFSLHSPTAKRGTARHLP